MEHPLFDVLCKINSYFVVFENIMMIFKGDKCMENNIISKVLYFVGIGTIMVGVVASLIIGGPINNIAIIIGKTIASIISGIILIGFGEVISLLQKIKNSIYKNYNE